MHAVGGRRVRPRPVNYNERLPVVRMYGGDEDLDPSLEAFLEAQEEEHALMRALEEGGSPKPKGKNKQVSSHGRMAICLAWMHGMHCPHG